MNGVHDMGGMHGMGIEYDKDEPVFHHAWEGRVFAMRRAVGAWGKWNMDATRHAIERIPAGEYLGMSYYERQLAAFLEMLVQHGFVTRRELASSTPAPDSPKAVPVLTAAGASALIAKGVPASRSRAVAPRFQTGQRVRARNTHPVGHTRLPRYARGKFGIIHRNHGVFVFPDTNACFQGEKPQHVYSVRFRARELWGEHGAENDSVYVDLWDDYLEPA